MLLNSKILIHKGLSGIDAEKLLIEQGVPGSFLVRQSRSSPGDFTLTVRRTDSFAHIRIQNTGDFLSLAGGENFATAIELINHYLNNWGQLKEKNGSIIDLRYPITAEDVSLEGACWFHGHLTAKEAQNLLLGKGSNGSFLVRESIHQPGSFVLSVVTGNLVSHILIRRQSNAQFDVGGGPQFQKLGQLIDHYTKFPMMDKNGGIVVLKQPFLVTRFMISNLDKRIAQLEKEHMRGTNVSGFLKEFEELHEDTHDKARMEGRKPYNLPKNRFRNILPFDVTRVILRDCKAEDLGADYINANYICIPTFLKESLQLAVNECESNAKISHDNLESPSRASVGRRKRFLSDQPQYIATQGVLVNTVVDFWRMVWQEQSSIIVALTKENEPGKNNKCERYWPNAVECQQVLTTPTGCLCIRHQSEQNVQDNLIREFLVTFTETSPTTRASFLSTDPPPSLTVYLFQFLRWPEQGTLRDPSNLLNFLFNISTFQEDIGMTGPMIVHCSSGVGRTGTFIAVDMLVNCVREGGLHTDIDIARTVAFLREQRSGMVQTEAQYRFIYKALQEFISRLLLRLQLRNALQPSGVDYTNLKHSPNECLFSSNPHVPPSSSLPTPKSGWRSINQPNLRFGESAPCSDQPPIPIPHSSYQPLNPPQKALLAGGSLSPHSSASSSSTKNNQKVSRPWFKLTSRRPIVGGVLNCSKTGSDFGYPTQ